MYVLIAKDTQNSVSHIRRVINTVVQIELVKKMEQKSYWPKMGRKRNYFCV